MNKLLEHKPDMPYTWYELCGLCSLTAAAVWGVLVKQYSRRFKLRPAVKMGKDLLQKGFLILMLLDVL